MPKIAVIIPAAGRGQRFGGLESKVFAKLDGRPVFLRTIELFVNRDDVGQTLLVISSADMAEMKTRYGANLGFMGVKVVQGGERRIDSVRAALQQVGDEFDFVAIHDAVRPCTSTAMIDAVFAEAIQHGAAILACPLNGTIKRVSPHRLVDGTVPRDNLYEAHTPQVFERRLLMEAYAKNVPADEEITDDAQLVERLGRPVSVVLSDASNLKITTRADIPLASAILKYRPQAKPTRTMGAFEEAQW